MLTPGAGAGTILIVDIYKQAARLKGFAPDGEATAIQYQVVLLLLPKDVGGEWIYTVTKRGRKRHQECHDMSSFPLELFLMLE